MNILTSNNNNSGSNKANLVFSAVPNPPTSPVSQSKQKI